MLGAETHYEVYIAGEFKLREMGRLIKKLNDDLEMLRADQQASDEEIKASKPGKGRIAEKLAEVTKPVKGHP